MRCSTMQTRTVFAIGLLLLLASVGCQNYSSPSVAAGSMPPIPTAVGPIPGSAGGPVPIFRTDPFANDAVALQEGRKLFNWYNCSGCHGGHAGGGMGPSLRDGSWLYGSTPDRIFSSIAQGRGNGMPSWGSRLPERHIWELTLYVSSLRTPDEPEAP